MKYIDDPATVFYESNLEDVRAEQAIYAMFIEDYCCEEHLDFALAKMNFLIEAEQMLEGLYEEI
jgi:hypothetical protein